MGTPAVVTPLAVVDVAVHAVGSAVPSDQTLTFTVEPTTLTLTHFGVVATAVVKVPTGVEVAPICLMIDAVAEFEVNSTRMLPTVEFRARTLNLPTVVADVDANWNRSSCSES
jgi:hypothetical protein